MITYGMIAKGVRWIESMDSIYRVAAAQDDEYLAFLYVHSILVKDRNPNSRFTSRSTQQLNTLTKQIVKSAAAHPLYPLVKRRKEAALLEGSISRAGWMENMVFGRKIGWAERLFSVVLVDAGMSFAPRRFARS